MGNTEEAFLVAFESENVGKVFEEICKQFPQMKGDKEFEYEKMECGNKGCMPIKLKTANAKSKLVDILKSLKDVRLIDMYTLDTLIKTPFEEFVKNISKK